MIDPRDLPDPNLPNDQLPIIDEAIDKILAVRLTNRRYRLWWYAEGEVLGGLTPLEALVGGERLAVIELAQGRPGDPDVKRPLIDTERADQIRRDLEARRGDDVR